jgi:Rrf2 family protein
MLRPASRPSIKTALVSIAPHLVPCSVRAEIDKSSSSMQLTRAADYGIRVMIYLAALPGNKRVMLPTLADATGAPGSFLSKILQALSRAGLITSRRGQAGGFQILPLGREASIRTVIEVIEGPVTLNRCLANGESCSRKSWCPAHPVWVRAQQAMVEVLDAAKIADLAFQSRS